jgi:hypothetical protein
MNKRSRSNSVLLTDMLGLRLRRGERGKTRTMNVRSARTDRRLWGRELPRCGHGQNESEPLQITN